MHHPKPRVVLSRCLELEACRYNGQAIRAPFVLDLLPFVEVVPVCPEVEIGLGVPRDPIRLVGELTQPRLVQPGTHRDLTREMTEFSTAFLGSLQVADGFVLKSRSPSCGIKDTKVYGSADQSVPSGKTAGLFGGAVLDQFPFAAVEDEGRLTNARLRHHFLTKLFANARLRTAKTNGTTAALEAFHTHHKSLLLAYHQGAARRLGRTVAASSEQTIADTFACYQAELARALARPARTRSIVSALTDAFGQVSDGLSSREQSQFLDALQECQAGRKELHAPMRLLQCWGTPSGGSYLELQALLDPFPKALLNLRI